MLLHFLKRTVGHHMGLAGSQLVNSWAPSRNSHRADAWQATLRASLFLLIFFLKLELVREGKYSQLQFQILLSSEPKPNIPPGTGGQNQDDLQ